MSANSLQAQALVKHYGRRAVVDQVSLQVHRQEIVGLLGANGSGKTTTFQIMAGLTPPDSGQVLLSGQDISRLFLHERAAKGIGFLPQGASVFRKLTVADNIRVALEVYQPQAFADSEAAIPARLEQLLEEFHLTKVRDSLGRSLSGGERRRTEIARALASQPKFILLDEPFAGVDPIATAELIELIRSLRARGLGILLTEHNIAETLRLCDRCYIINGGKIIANDTTDRIVNDQQVRKVYLGENFSL